MEHYYSKKPSSKSDRKIIEAKIGGFKFKFVTDAGVFSKHKIDTGTEILINAAQKTDFPSGNILDLGCGYGPIGLAIAKNFPERLIEMVDINERSISLSKDNASRNKIENVKIYPSNIFDEVITKDFAGIISNPPIRAGKKIVHKMLEESYNHLIKDGKLQIVIQRKQGAPSAKKKMEEVFGNVKRIDLEKGYWVLESVKTK